MASVDAYFGRILVQPPHVMLQRRTSSRLAAVTLSALVGGVAAVSAPVPAANAGETVHVLVLKEHGAGSASSAQGFVDRLMGRLAEVAGFAGASGKYQTSRKLAKTWIADNHPAFGIVSLAAFLDLRKAHGLSVVGKVDVASGGGRQYHLVSKTAKDLAGCKGHKVASDHFDDERFVEKVVARGAFALSDFDAEATRRPVQTLKKVIEGEATCALVDDAQLEYLGKLDGGAAVKSVWKSAELPPMVVVAFGGADKGTVAKLKKNLDKVCSGAGKEACKEVGIKSLAPASDADYAKVTKAY